MGFVSGILEFFYSNSHYDEWKIFMVRQIGWKISQRARNEQLFYLFEPRILGGTDATTYFPLLKHYDRGEVVSFAYHCYHITEYLFGNYWACRVCPDFQKMMKPIW